MFGRVWNFLKPFFTPAAPVIEKRPPPDELSGRYVRSFLFLRLTIGFLGFALPLALVFIDWKAFNGDPVPRDSLSVYYYSGMREVFTVTLGTIAFFLFAYKITERNLDNTLSILAGLAGMLIPLCPTSPPTGLNPQPALTPLQELLSEKWTTRIHFGASAAFIALLGTVCWFFGRREGERTDPQGWVPRSFWKFWHSACAGAIGVAGVWILLTTKIFGHGPVYHGHPYWSLLLGEWIATWAFGLSWLAKGAELKYLFGFEG
jgi:hypothetical protein